MFANSLAQNEVSIKVENVALEEGDGINNTIR